MSADGLLLKYQFHSFSLTRPELELAVYPTKDEHANHITSAMRLKLQ
jgi:hypothetical protein